MNNKPAVDKQGVGSGTSNMTLSNSNDYNPREWKSEKKVRPNDKCNCGSGKKYKKCCMYK